MEKNKGKKPVLRDDKKEKSTKKIERPKEDPQDQKNTPLKPEEKPQNPKTPRVEDDTKLTNIITTFKVDIEENKETATEGQKEGQKEDDPDYTPTRPKNAPPDKVTNKKGSQVKEGPIRKRAKSTDHALAMAPIADLTASVHNKIKKKEQEENIPDRLTPRFVKCTAHLESNQDDPLVHIDSDAVTIESLPRELRTEKSTVPDDLQKIQPNIAYIYDSVQFFTKDWKVVKCKNQEYRSNSTLQQLSSGPEKLQDIPYSIDIVETEHGSDDYLLDEDLLNWSNFDKAKALPILSKSLTEKREDIFDCFPMLTPCDPPDKRFSGRPFTDESEHLQLMVTCNSLTFDVGEYEPFFCSLALYNMETHEKLSETFEFDVNQEGSLKLLGSFLGERDPATKSHSCIFKLLPAPNLYLLVAITKVIKGEGDEKDLNKVYINHSRLKPKQKEKFTAEIAERLQVLGGYRQLFAMGVIKVCDDSGDNIILNGDIILDDLKIVKFDKSFYATLTSLIKEPKKLKNIPGKMSFSARLLAPGLEGRIDPAYLPVKPQGEPITRELEVFGGFGVSHSPYSTYVSHLYFYPEIVNFRNYSRGSINARTILVEVKLLADGTDPDQPGIPAIYGDSTGQSLVSSKRTMVTYHNPRPLFFDEIKIILPYHMTPYLHLLVSFYHVKCEIQKKKDKDVSGTGPETLLARTVIPVYPNSRIISDGPSPVDVPVPVYYELPKDYLSPQKDAPPPDPKLNFSYRVKSITTLYTQDKYLAKIFECESQQDDKSLKEALEQIHLVSLSSLVHHMSPLLDFLFRIMCNFEWVVLQQSAFGTMVEMLDRVFNQTRRHSFLESYVEYHLENLKGCKQLLFEVVPRVWLKNVAVAKDTRSFRFCWFFFGIIYKSMVLHIDSLKNSPQKTEVGEKEEVVVETKEPEKKEPEEEKIVEGEQKDVEKDDEEIRFGCFTNSWYFEIRHLVMTMSNVIQRSFTNDRELAVFLNLNTAFFLRDLLTIGHKGHLFSIIEKYIPVEESTKPNLIEEKWKFLSVLCAHELYVQLNNPVPLTLKSIGELQEYFAKKHFLAGVVLRELKISINKLPGTRALGIQVLRDLIWRHERDPRFSSPEARQKIAQFYFPLILIVIDHREHLFGSSSAVSEEERRNWLACFTYVLKNVDINIKRNWWKSDAEKRKIGLLATAVDCLKTFQYIGLENLKKRGNILRSTNYWTEFTPTKRPQKVTQTPATPGTLNATTGGTPMATRKKETTTLAPLQPTPTQEYLTQYYENRKFQSDRDKRQKFSLKQEDAIKMEKNLARETTRTFLQTVLQFVQDHRKDLLQTKNSETNGMTDWVFRVLIECLKASQSEETFSEIFRVIHVIVAEFSKLVFRFRNTFCGEVVYEVLKECNSKFAKTRAEAGALIVLMIEKNFQEMGQIARMKLQCATAISRMFGPNLPAPNEKDLVHLKHSLKTISIYSKGRMLQHNEDKKPYGTEVAELVSRLFNLIDANIQLEQYSFDPDTKAVFYYRMSLSYLDSPDLRITQLDKLASLHEKEQNFETAATVKVLAAALTRQYLALLNRSPSYFSKADEYARIFPSIKLELTMPKESELTSVKDEICQGWQFTEQGYIEYLNSAVELLRNAKLFETCVEVYNLILPIYRHQRNYKSQAECYSDLNRMCNSVVSETESGRIFALYYRVVFYAGGSDVMKELHTKEFIYKGKPGLRIAEFKENLKTNFEVKFGPGKVSFLSNLSTVDLSSLENGSVYLQVMAVDPFFSSEDIKTRPSQYEQNFDIDAFIFETPFTKDGGKAYTEDVSKQWKRKTTLKVERVFPFVTNRIQVTKKQEVELSPIENAIELINNKVQALQTELAPFDINRKTLAIQLHGTLLTQVNAGPLAVAQTFLAPGVRENFEPNLTESMDKVFITFVQLLSDALGRQKPQIDTHEIPIQTELERAYFEFKSEVCKLTNASVDLFNESFSPPDSLILSPRIGTSTESPSGPPIVSSKKQGPGTPVGEKEKRGSGTLKNPRTSTKDKKEKRNKVKPSMSQEGRVKKQPKAGIKSPRVQTKQ